MLTFFAFILFLLIIAIMIYLNIQVNEFENKYKQLEDILSGRFQDQNILDEENGKTEPEKITEEEEK